MVMVLKRKLSYHKRLFILLIVFSWVMVCCFITFQYMREKQFKAEKLDSRLQLFNKRLTDALADGVSPAKVLSEGKLPYRDLRISIIDEMGILVFDNSLDSLPRTNHLDRPEIVAAMKYGTGYTVRRHSASTDCNYFYSAMKDGGFIVRSAVPYSMSLQEVLAADNGFLWFMFSVTFILSIAGYFATRRLGQTIQRLNRFAEKAERGERIYEDEAFPHDELGEISNHIIRLYARLQRAKEELHREHERSMHEEQEKIRIKKQLTNNINHELKTPVAAIKACLETLIAHPDLAEDKRNDFIRRCYADSERLCRMLVDVATITRMDEANQQVVKETMILNSIIDDILKESEIRLAEAGITAHVDISGQLVVHANYSLMESVFRNLIDNAIAYSGCTNIYITLLEHNQDFCRISFADDGIGVEGQHIPHLFERFYRIDKGRSRKLGGTGLGLSIVKNAIVSHGGTIKVENRREGGLEFIFTLPCRIED